MATDGRPSPCSECGVENTADSNFCKRCGVPLGASGAKPHSMGVAERTRDRCLDLLRANPDNARTHYELGLAYYHLGQAGNATRAFERVVALEDAA